MKITKDTKFPFCTKSENSYYYYLSNRFLFTITNSKIQSFLSSSWNLVISDSEIKITKKEFLKENYHLLKETGLGDFFKIYNYEYKSKNDKLVAEISDVKKNSLVINNLYEELQKDLDKKEATISALKAFIENNL